LKVLIDNCVPFRFKRLLPGHEVFHCGDLGWEQLSNGKLLVAAEREGFSVLVTVDRSMQYQQNMAHRKISIVYLRVPRNNMPAVAPLAGQVLERLSNLIPGTIVMISHPDMR
jgi:predicted nuclease of predicted toxin-antitoxin system